MNSDAIKFANKRAKKEKRKNITFRYGICEDLPFKDESFDLVIASDVLDHVIDYKKGLKEIYGVLKRNGEIVLTVENKRSLWPIVEFLWDKFGRGRDYKHTHLVKFTVETLKKELFRVDFKLKKIYTVHNIRTFFYLVVDWYPRLIDNFLKKHCMGLTIFCRAIR